MHHVRPELPQHVLDLAGRQPHLELPHRDAGDGSDGEPGVALGGGGGGDDDGVVPGLAQAVQDPADAGGHPVERREEGLRDDRDPHVLTIRDVGEAGETGWGVSGGAQVSFG